MGASDIVKASRVMEIDKDSGLSVPGHVLDERKDAARKRERWTWQNWKRYRRTVEDMLPRNVLPFLICNGCKQPLTLVRLDGRSVVEEKIDYKTSDELSLRCDCTDRVMGHGV